MNNSVISKSTIALILGAMLVGCGGGEEDSGTTPNPTPTSISIASVSVSVNEGAQGQRKDAKLTVRLSKIHDQAITLDYETSADNESAVGRFEASSGTITINAGERQKDLLVPVLGNERHELDGRVTVDLSLTGNNGNVKLVNNAASITITDDDPVPVVELHVDDIDVREGVGEVDIVAQIDRPSYKPVTANLRFDGLASSNDYDVTASSIVFQPDETSASTSVTIYEDDVIEGSETIDISIVNASNAEVGSNRTMRIIIQGDLKLNDTGVVSFYNNGNFNATSPDPDHPYQDADYGLDTDADFNQSNGFAGLFYNKIDEAGNALPANANHHECTFDAHTGLTWEIKGDYFHHDFLDDPSPEEEAQEIAYTNTHYNNSNGRYKWFNRDDSTNGGSRGGVNDRELDHPVLASNNCMFPHREHPLHIPTVTQRGCTTDKYVELINQAALCGFIDWRMPTINELQTLVVYEDQLRGYDTNYFPNSTQADASFDERDFVYLSASPSVDNDASVWCLDAAERRVKLCNKTDAHHIRLVRGNKF